jgi:tetratricopeptide (TPR) repeat protein
MGHFLAGYVLDKQKKIKDAIEEYEKALAKDDKFIDAHKNLAILCVSQNPNYQDKDKTKKALDHFKRYFELGGKDDALKQTYEQIKSFIEGQRGGK